MENVQTYLAIDRYHALAQGRNLPHRSSGCALFADISGFTELTEALTRAFGAHQGAELLTIQLNRLYTALVDQVNHYGGSVVSFAGDALLAWFDGDAVRPALASALAMQRAMRDFRAIPLPDGSNASLALKIGLGAGPARRFVVGDPATQRLDVMAGETISCMARAELLAEQGEILLDGDTAAQLGASLEIAGWRTDGSFRAAIVAGLLEDVPPRPWPPLPAGALSPEELRSWLPRSVAERLQDGRDALLAELRPVVVLFLGFGGIDYEHPAAEQTLNRFVFWVQEVLDRYGGTLLSLTNGDKGSYLYAAFGAPVAHEDDASRAIAAALTLRNAPVGLGAIHPIRIGVSQGVLYSGMYGGRMRRTYSVLGDEVNVAARLMEQAGPSAVIVSAPVQEATANLFSWEALPPIRLKGKREELPIYRLRAAREQWALALESAAYALPMVGRTAELALIGAHTDRVQAGTGAIVAISGEAGIGKSRLLAEALDLAAERGFQIVGGACQSYGTQMPYLVWQPIWRAVLRLPADAPPEDWMPGIVAQLEQINPALVSRLPLLGPLLGHQLPDNDLTAAMDPKLRQEALHSLLLDYLRAVAQAGPLLIVLEDCHWLDPSSELLLAEIVRAIAALGPVMVLLSLRPIDQKGPAADAGMLGMLALPTCTQLTLLPFTDVEAAELVTLRLALRADMPLALPAEVVRTVIERAQGNPFYLDELVSYIQQRAVAKQDGAALSSVELPENVQRLILSRIDQLAEREQTLLKVASILGRVINLAWLAGFNALLGGEGEIRRSMHTLQREELVLSDIAEPELVYLFKHMITREGIYSSLPASTRAQLHGQLAQWLEEHSAVSLDVLAHHYGHSALTDKQVEYYHKAGDVAASFAPATAASYYRQLLAVLPDDSPSARIRLEIYQQLAQMLVYLGELSEALQVYQLLLSEAAQLGETGIEAWVWNKRSFIQDMQGDFEAVAISAERAAELARRANDQHALAQALIQKGWSLFRRGFYAEALEFTQEARALSEREHAERVNAESMYLLGTTSLQLGRYKEALDSIEQALTRYQQLGDRYWQSMMLNALGNISESEGDLPQAAYYFGASIEHALALGHRPMVLLGSINLSYIRSLLGEYGAAEPLARSAIQELPIIGAVVALPWAYRALAESLLGQGRGEEALSAVRMGFLGVQETGEPETSGLLWRAFGKILWRWPELSADEDTDSCFAKSIAIFKDIQLVAEEARTLREWARYARAQGDLERGDVLWGAAMAIFERLGLKHERAVLE